MNKSNLTSLLVTALLLTGCGHKTNNDSTAIDSIEIAEEEPTPDIEIGLDIDNSNNEYVGGNETLKYRIASDETCFVVEPTSPYYDKYVSGQDFEIPLVVEYLDDDFIDGNMYPKFYCYIQNNTSESISISSIDIYVEKSSLDKLPYFRIATEEALSNHIVFSNESWFNYGGITFDYTILKKGESFNGYKKKKHIPYFKDVYQLDLTNDLVAMGYNYERIHNLSDMKDDPYFNKCCSLGFGSGELDYYSNLFYPFEITRASEEEDSYMGIARIYGKISFDNSTFSAKFHGNISLSYPADFGAALEEDDSYDVELKTDGNNYVISYPYETALEPNQSRKVGITMLCSKSSNHILTIKANNDKGLAIWSKPIKLHYLNPRHSSKIIWQGVKNDYK